MSTAIERRLRRQGPTDLVVPSYDDYCFSNVPGTIGEAIGVDLGRRLPAGTVPTTGIDTVVCILLDGLGLVRYRRDGMAVSLLSRLADEGTMTPLTAPFPSETSAAIATYHTGRPPAAHGVLGGMLYLPSEDFTLRVLAFARRGGPEGSATDHGLGPSILNTDATIHERLDAAEVNSYCIQPHSTLSTPYAAAFLAGSSRHGYDDATDAGRTLRTIGERATAPTVIYCYLPHVDVLSHRHGPDAGEYRQGLRTACAGVESGLDTLRSRQSIDPERTLVLLIADHGHVQASPQTYTDLHSDPVIEGSLITDDHGPRAFTGGPRNVLLHVRPDRVDRVRTHLAERYAGHVFTRTEALDELALFGPTPSERARRRCGSLVYVPEEGGAGDGESFIDKRSLHGGLSPREMLVPCVSMRLSDL